jgi:hypothetical protein
VEATAATAVPAAATTVEAAATTVPAASAMLREDRWRAGEQCDCTACRH